MSEAFRFVVVQRGARMNYAVPALLASAGMLEALYTDIHAGTWPARFLSAWPERWRTRALRRLMGRRLPPELRDAEVHTVPLRSALSARDPEICGRLLAHGFGEANALYAFSHGDLDAIRAARRAGLYVVFEQVIGPTHNAILSEERSRFPGLERQETDRDCVRYLEAHREIWSLADLVLAPSEFVAEGIVELGGAPEKVRLVPYGIPESLLEREPEPVPGRVLFVGQVGLRKGSHYLAEAARLLIARHVPCEIRVVGEAPAALLRDPRFEGPEYAGQVPRAEVHREFLAADVFVLPSLAEGSATAHLEALACGLPVIATPNAGTVVRDGVEGLLVPVRDAAALAEAIGRLVTDRRLRTRMAQAARERATNFTWPHYRTRLLAALEHGDEPEHGDRLRCPKERSLRRVDTGACHHGTSPSPTAAILWRHLGPYHLARAEAVRHLCDLTVLELAGAEPGCGWNGHRPDTSLRTLTLSPRDTGATSTLRTACEVWTALTKTAPGTVYIAGYSTLPLLAAALWCRRHRRRAVLFSETTPADRPRSGLREAVKSVIVRALYQRAIAGGKRQQAYLESLGFEKHSIGRPYNVVDNNWFRSTAAAFRRDESPLACALPDAPYFLYVGRLAPEKNLHLLLDAYGWYAGAGGEWHVVLAGDGPLAGELRRRAAAPGLSGRVHFTGSRHGRALAACYAFAGCFVLPSISEPWGLVLNEAMASGLPLLVSERCGSVDDLVQPGRNGYTFDPADEHALAACLRRIAALTPAERSAMGAASSALVENHSLAAWAAAFAHALHP